jgi:hypothetical protein
MADIAVQMNNVLTRDGLLGPTQPVLFVNGTVALPGIAFSTSPSSGLYRLSPNTVGMSVAGVSRQTWDTTGAGITGDFAVSGNFTVAGTFTVTGATTFTGQLLAAAGTAPLPSYSFTADPNTGMYSAGADILGFSTGGLLRGSFNANGKFTVEANATVSEPSVQVKSPATNGLAIDIQGESVTNGSTIRWLNNAYNQVRMQVLSNDSGNVLGGTTALQMQLFTNNLARVTIAATGGVTFATPTSGGHVINGTTTINGTTQVNGPLGASGDLVGGSNAYALNYYINPGTATAAGTFGIPGALGSAMIAWGNSSGGAGNMDFTTSGAYLLRMVKTASAVNYIQFNNAAAGTGPNLSVEGSDTNIQFNHFSKGTGVHAFFANGGAQFVVGSNPANPVNYLIVGGATAGNNVTVSASGGLAVRFPNLAVQVIGSGRPFSTTTESQSYLYNVALGLCNFTATPNNRCHEWYKDATALYGLWISDNGGAATEWLKSVGGQGAGQTSVTITSPTVLFTTTSGGVQITGSATSNGTLAITDTGAAGCNIKMVGDGGTTPKKFLRVTGGTFQIINDTYANQLFAVNEAGTLQDIRGLALVRDPGTTPTSGIPIGGMVIGSITAGVVINALGTFVANGTTNKIDVFAAGAGTATTITANTWRNCGSITASGNVCLFMRTA